MLKNLQVNYEGCKDLLDSDRFFYLAIVGSRNILPYTETVLSELFETLSFNKKVVIVSGGMYGVDIFAHNLALTNGLGTIIFLPCGIEFYKNSSLFTSLRNKNLNKNLLLSSSYDKSFSPRKYSYLERNRLLVDFSNSVLVAQSGESSGSFYSGNYAIKKGKILFSVPISILNRKFQGNNLLIKKGSGIYLNPQDFMISTGIMINSNLVSTEAIKKFLPSTESNLLEKLIGYDVELIKKTILEGILKGELIYEDGLILNKNDK